MKFRSLTGFLSKPPLFAAGADATGHPVNLTSPRSERYGVQVRRRVLKLNRYLQPQAEALVQLSKLAQVWLFKETY